VTFGPVKVRVNAGALRVGEKSDRRVEDLLAELRVLLAGPLLLEVLEAGPAEVAAHRRQVEVHVVEPFGRETLQEERAKRAALRAAQSMGFPDLGQQVLRIGDRHILDRVMGRDRLADELEAAVLHDADEPVVHVEQLGHLLAGDLAVEHQLGDLQVPQPAGILQIFDQLPECLGQDLSLQFVLLVVADTPAHAGIGRWHTGQQVGREFVVASAVDVLDQADRPRPAGPHPVDDRVSQDPEQVGLDACLDLQGVEGPDEGRERILDDVLGVGGLWYAGQGEL